MPFKYTPVTGKGSSSRSAILEFDGVKVLADPGWDGISNISYLDDVINSVDLILLSQPTLECIGAYAYLAFKDLQIPVYATLPVCNLGRVATIDLYRSSLLIGPVKGALFELNDVEEAFDKIINVKHNQTVDLRAKFDGLSITAVNSGHALGGTIWTLNKNSEKIIYAPEWNHSKDSFLNGADILQNPSLLRPSVLITSAMIGSNVSYKKRVEKFFELVDATLGRGGTVLLPTSIGGRMLELFHLIDDHLQSAPIPVLLLSHAKARSLTYAGSMLEWMAPAVIKEWESRGQATFDASRVQVIEPTELAKLPGAKVVFAAGVGFEKNSVSQTALLNLCTDEKTTIILTERALEGTIGYDLYSTWKSSVGAKLEDGIPVLLQKPLDLQSIREEPLVGDDLTIYESFIKGKRELKEQRKKQKTLTDIQFEDESDDESDADEEDLMDPDKKTEEKIPVDTDVRNLKLRSKMFPFISNKSKTDDYGVIINPADYSREEEKNVDKLKRKEQMKVKIGEKTKWNEGKKQDDVSDLDPLHNPRSVDVTELVINSRCALSYVDLAGLVDIRSFSLIIPSLKPKSVFLLSDLTEPANQSKISSLLKKHNTFEVFELSDNQVIEADNTVQSFDITLDESLNAQLKWQKIAGGFTIAHVIGEVKKKSELKHQVDAEGDVDLNQEDQEELLLVPLQQDSAYLSNVRASALAIGDVRLSELRKTLSEKHRVEFKGEGTMVIDDLVAVRKISDGDVIVDGAPGPLFYEVRDAVRKMLAYV